MQAGNRRGCHCIRAFFALFLVIASAVCAAQPVIYVSPVPNSTLVSPKSNIIIRTKGSLNPSVVSDPSLFSVRGSVSGEHTGSTILSDDKETIVFQPTSGYAPGEVVTVVVNLKGSGVEPLEFAFTITPRSGSGQKLFMKEAARASAKVTVPGPSICVIRSFPSVENSK